MLQRDVTQPEGRAPATLFAVGDRVVFADDGAEGTVTETRHDRRRDRWNYRVSWDDGVASPCEFGRDELRAAE